MVDVAVWVNGIAEGPPLIILNRRLGRKALQQSHHATPTEYSRQIYHVTIMFSITLFTSGRTQSHVLQHGALPSSAPCIHPELTVSARRHSVPRRRTSNTFWICASPAVWTSTARRQEGAVAVWMDYNDRRYTRSSCLGADSTAQLAKRRKGASAHGISWTARQLTLRQGPKKL